MCTNDRGGTADERDQTSEDSDPTSQERDDAGGRRDHAAHLRDQVGEEQRDRSAEQRDEWAEHADASTPADTMTEALGRLSQSRRDAFSDRKHSSQDRAAAAGERADAEIDRDTAQSDRAAGAGERLDAELDRTRAQSDRTASATDRDNALVDDVTGVYLRGPGFVELAREIARAKRTQQPLVLAFVDVDGLKAVNDSRGHAAGDQLLLAVADTLRGNLRPYDVIIRYGGDEFVCVLTGLNPTEVTQRFASISAALAEASDQGSVTVGIAALQEHESTETLVGRADAALYRARENRRRSRA